MGNSYNYELKIKFHKEINSPSLKEKYFDIPGKYDSNCIDGVRASEFINYGISTFLITSKNPDLTLEIFRKDLEAHLNGKLDDFEIISFGNFVFGR